MQITMSIDNLSEMLKKQLNNFYYLNSRDEADIAFCLGNALSRVEKCFNKISNKYY